MHSNKKILVAVDDSEASTRAVRYVASIIGKKRGFVARLLHVLDPLPPAFREFGGAENGTEEVRLERELRDKQEPLIARSESEAWPALERGKSILKNAGMPAGAIETEFWESVNRGDLANDILEVGRLNQCGTIVVGRESFSWLREIFHHHVADELVLKGHGFTLWVVE
jgi:nucleotide-binding universal stress UspA family protein